MPARRCSDCGINFPIIGFMRCRGCGHTTEAVRNALPDPDWKELAEEVRRQLEEASKPYTGIVDIEASVYTREGFHFVSSLDVCRSGYVSTLQPDTILRINELLYEVAGYSESRREYWLIPFDLDARETVNGSLGDDIYV
jgi:hypothetical protein